MRKLFIPLLAVVMFSSCSKESCWECDVQTAGGLQYREQFCDRSKKDIQQMQDNPLHTKDATGKIIYTTSFSNCTRR